MTREATVWLKTTMAALRDVRIDAAQASVIPSKLESLSLLQEAQRMALKAFLNRLTNRLRLWQGSPTV